MGEGVIRDFESGNRVPNPSKMIAIRRALEAAGILFVSDGQQIAGGLGVRLKAGGSPHILSRKVRRASSPPAKCKGETAMAEDKTTRDKTSAALEARLTCFRNKMQAANVSTDEIDVFQRVAEVMDDGRGGVDPDDLIALSFVMASEA
ncbi:hypothetical protein RFM98_30640 [Mesorhizobium sp. VK9D]|uniref:hypothetical protein n=1 Tax=Mesorhizobium australafricanum TaxID=3072311 RepID=UPI002A2418BF|nr:hypothetical protein [Mesorhizobium sp. VK9D]MDX8457096.1 hypothetical protein [Mesorhizobium sp. VK9D]